MNSPPSLKRQFLKTLRCGRGAFSEFFDGRRFLSSFLTSVLSDFFPPCKLDIDGHWFSKAADVVSEMRTRFLLFFAGVFFPHGFSTRIGD